MVSLSLEWFIVVYTWMLMQSGIKNANINIVGGISYIISLVLHGSCQIYHVLLKGIICYIGLSYLFLKGGIFAILELRLG